MKSELDLHGIAIGRRRGALIAGPIFCPTYLVDDGSGDKVLIDDEAYTADDENTAAVIAIQRRHDTRLSGLIWSRKIGVVTLRGILSRRGRVGPFDVLFIAGPTFDAGRRSDDRVAAARRAAGLPTGLPGDRKIIVTSKSEL